MFPIQLSAPEMAALLAWPIGDPFVVGLPPQLSRQLPASDLVPKEGRIIGTNSFPGRERPVALSYFDARKHMLIRASTEGGRPLC